MTPPPVLSRRLIRSFVLFLTLWVPCAALAAENAKEQMEFGVKAAKKGLWREALFRWEKALKLDPTNAHIINNLAVAYETAGQFDKANDLYRQALRVDPGNRDIKQNYDLFTSYFKQIQTRQEKHPAPPPPPPADSEPAPPPPADDSPPPR
jgi:tetratricopeptide (TPR) repeat protein